MSAVMKMNSKNVLLNFLTNSRDAIVASGIKKGNVEIIVSDLEDRVQVCVEDNGGGINEEMLSNIFDPYVSTKGENGTGLGLYMSKLIIKDRMGGDITIENTAEGLRVCVILDKCDPEAVQNKD